MTIYSARTTQEMFGWYRLYESGGIRICHIFVSEDLNYCWTRYVAAKEMCHVLIDNSCQDYRSIDFEKQLDSLLFNGFSIEHNISAESDAAFLAAELMCPYDYNSTLTSALTSYEIAIKYGMPERIVDPMRSPKYQSARHDANAQQ